MTLDHNTSTTAPITAHQNHVKAAEHCDAASAAHKVAAKHVEAGDAKEAGYHAAVAQGHTIQANEHSKIACIKAANAAVVK